VKGIAPAPVTIDVAIGAAMVKLTYDSTTGALRYDTATLKMAPTDRVLGLTLQRSEGDKPGPIVAQLLAPNQITGSGTITMRGRNREDLVEGRLFMHFYTKQMPLGFERQRVTLR
jgi:amidase